MSKVKIEFLRTRYFQLVLAILTSLFGYNIFKCLFERVSYARGECGSFVRPVLANATTTVGWFFSKTNVSCPRLMTGKLSEAFFSAFLFVVTGIFLRRNLRVQHE